MFKQITNFESFNIFVGNQDDLKFKEETNEFSINDVIIKVLELRNLSSDIFVTNVLDKVNDKDVYIVSNDKGKFIEFWFRGMIKYLN